MFLCVWASYIILHRVFFFFIHLCSIKCGKCANHSAKPLLWHGWRTTLVVQVFINLAVRDITDCPALPNTGAFDPVVTTEWKKKQHQGSGRGAMIMQNSSNSYQQLGVVAQLTFPWAPSVRSSAPAVLWSILTWLHWEQVQTACVESWKRDNFYRFSSRQCYCIGHQASITPFPFRGRPANVLSVCITMNSFVTDNWRWDVFCGVGFSHQPILFHCSKEEWHWSQMSLQSSCSTRENSRNCWCPNKLVYLRKQSARDLSTFQWLAIIESNNLEQIPDSTRRKPFKNKFWLSNNVCWDESVDCWCSGSSDPWTTDWW